MALDERLKHELERAGRPADPTGVYEELIRRRERRRIVRKVESGVLAIAVVAVSVAGVYGLSRVFGEDAERDAATPSVPTPSPTPTASPARFGKDIGLGFPVCNVTSVRGAFAPGLDGKAYVATKAGDMACPDLGDGMQVLAVDVTGDGLADASYGPLECDQWCSAFAAPDVDGDGTDELLVQNVEFSIIGLTLFEVDPGDSGAAIGPVTVAPPGDPGGGFEPGAVPQLWLGGDAFSIDTLRCGTVDGPTGPGFVYTTAESLPHDSPKAKWHAREVTFVLRNWELHIVNVREFTEPVVPGPPSFQSGETLCGSNLGPSQG